MLGRIIQTLCILQAAIIAISEGKPDVPLAVHGITDRSVDLILQINGTDAVKEIYWNFQSLILAHFKNNHLDIKKPQFDKRLEILENGSILRINNLTKEDSGSYHVTVQCMDRSQDSASYILRVYDPVPTLTIQTEKKKDTSGRCNITLHCFVPSNSSNLFYTWKYRHQDSTYQLYSEGSTIQISVPPDHQDMEFLCIAKNPADQRNVSTNIRRDCSHQDTLRSSKGDWRHYYTLFLIPSALVVISGLFLLKRYNKKEKAEKKRWKESKEMQEIHYADLALETKSCEWRAGPKTEEHNNETVYSAVVSEPM